MRRVHYLTVLSCAVGSVRVLHAASYLDTAGHRGQLCVVVLEGALHAVTFANMCFFLTAAQRSQFLLSYCAPLLMPPRLSRDVSLTFEAEQYSNLVPVIQTRTYYCGTPARSPVRL